MENTKSNINVPFVCRVSSTINRDVKSFGKQFMFDGNDETCWNSDEGNMQWITISYEKPIDFSKISIQFQGGFAAEECSLEIVENDSQNISETITFENNNLIQNIKLSKSYKTSKIKLLFTKCYDTYGRIVIYHLFFNTDN